MTDAWPGTLPQKFRSPTYHRETPDNRLRAQTDSGPAKVRARGSARPAPVTGAMTMTIAQWATLQTFGVTTLIGWTLPFTFPDPDHAGATLLVRFGERLPTRDPFGRDRLTVSLDLEVLP